MKFYRIIFISFLALFFVACEKDNHGDDDPNLEPLILSGSQTAPVVLENIFTNPNRVDYIIQGTWRVEAPVVVEPGVRFSMASNARILVRGSGSLRVVGTAERPVIFEGEVEAAGYWDYIAFESNNPDNRLEHAIVRHGGGSTLSSYPAAVTLSSNSQVSVVNTVISDSQRNGFRVGDNDSRIPEFRGNTISNCALYPIVLRTSQVQFIDSTTDFSSGNGFNKIEVQGNTVSSPMAIQPASGPYLFQGTSNFDALVEILAGTLIEMGPNARIQIRSSGALSAVGSSSERITITGEQPAKGYWDYIYFNGSNSPDNRFRFVDISYGGGSTLSCCGSAVALAGNALVAMENSAITNSQRWGVRVRGNSTFEDLGGNLFDGNEMGDIDK